MSKYDFPTQFECQNRILNIKIAFSDSVRMSKWDFECQNKIFRLSSNIEKRKAKNEKRKEKNEKRKAKSGKRNTKSEKRKAKNENQTNFTMLEIWYFLDFKTTTIVHISMYEIKKIYI